jgi:hypothetical protein
MRVSGILLFFFGRYIKYLKNALKLIKGSKSRFAGAQLQKNKKF